MESEDPYNIDPVNSDTEDEKPTPKKQKNISQKLSPGRKTIPHLEDSPLQVQEILKNGCECKESCFSDLNPEGVYKHRLNIADLTKEEHDMYLMGVMMASLANRNETSRHKERIRQRPSYVYQGQKVCLVAFLYLENVTHYHLKRIRYHVIKNGVSPRVHGNQGKIPHNTFSLDLYKSVEMFLKNYLSKYTDSTDLTKHIVIHGKSRSQIFNEYKLQFEKADKVMAYTTFRNFMHKQFPNVRFTAKVENGKMPAGSGPSNKGNNQRDKELSSGKRTYNNIVAKTTKNVILSEGDLILEEHLNENEYEAVEVDEQQIINYVDESQVHTTIWATDPDSGQYINIAG